MRKLFAILSIVGVVSAAELRAQDWGFQLFGVDSLRGLTDVSVQAAFTAYAEPASSISKQAGLTKDALQKQVETRLKDAKIPVTSQKAGRGILSIQVQMVCAPIQPIVCSTNLALRLSQTVKTPSGQEIMAVTWESATDDLGPGSDLPKGDSSSPTVNDPNLTQLVDQFVRDWGNSHKK
jgi:hypothetical protein